MFTLFHIGAVEVLSVFIVSLTAGLLSIYRMFAWRWLAVLTFVLTMAMICTPADPLSMLLVAIPTCVVFAAGVTLAPYLIDRPRT